MTQDELTICLEYLDEARAGVQSGKIKTITLVALVEGEIPDYMTLGEVNYDEALQLVGALEVMKKTFLDCIDAMDKTSEH